MSEGAFFYERSENLDLFAPAFILAQAEFKPAEKNAEGNFKNAFADLFSIEEATKPALTKHGFCFFQFAEAQANIVKIKSTLMHKSTQYISSSLILQAKDGSPQSVGSAISYGRRYAKKSMLDIAEVDDDGELAQHGFKPGATNARPIESNKLDKESRGSNVKQGIQQQTPNGQSAAVNPGPVQHELKRFQFDPENKKHVDRLREKLKSHGQETKGFIEQLVVTELVQDSPQTEQAFDDLIKKVINKLTLPPSLKG